MLLSSYLFPCFSPGVSVDTGSDIAKEAADVILLEKSLLVLEHGVSQGRETHGECCCQRKPAPAAAVQHRLAACVCA